MAWTFGLVCVLLFIGCALTQQQVLNSYPQMQATADGGFVALWLNLLPQTYTLGKPDSAYSDSDQVLLDNTITQLGLQHRKSFWFVRHQVLSIRFPPHRIDEYTLSASNFAALPNNFCVFGFVLRSV